MGLQLQFYSTSLFCTICTMKGYWNIFAVLLTASLTLSAQASFSICKFSSHYPHKASCLVMRIEQLVTNSNLSEMKNKILSTCLQGNCRDRLGKLIFINSVFRVKRVKSTVLERLTKTKIAPSITYVPS